MKPKTYGLTVASGIEWIDMSKLWVAEDEDIENFENLVRQDERESITQGYKDMLSALKAIVAVAETETSFSMQTIKDCAKIAIAQTIGKK